MAQSRFRRLLCISIAALVAVVATPVAACDLGEGKRYVVTKVESADTLVFDGGDSAVLIGALPPQSAPGAASDWPPREQTRLDLQSLVLGKTVELATSGRSRDRYGRWLAQVFLPANVGNERLWVQGELIAGGLARAYGLPGSLACLGEMLALETAARTDQRGHWGSGIFADHAASDAKTLRADRNSFATLLGTVARTERRMGQTSLVFADESGQETLQAILSQGRDDRRASSGSTALAGLVGRQVRLRGWIEPRVHPVVMIYDAQMIEPQGAANAHP